MGQLKGWISDHLSIGHIQVTRLRNLDSEFPNLYVNPRSRNVAPEEFRLFSYLGINECIYEDMRKYKIARKPDPKIRTCII
jgi:hypothetical protein